MVEVVERTADQVFIPLTVGGGVRSVSDIRELLSAGADKVSINTAAISDRTSSTAGRRALVASASSSPSTLARRAARLGRLHAGGRAPKGLDAVAWAREGVGAGPGKSCSPAWTAMALVRVTIWIWRAVSAAINIPVIASGGAGNLGSSLRRLAPGAPMRRWPRRSSTSASTPSPASRTDLAAAGVRCGRRRYWRSPTSQSGRIPASLSPWPPRVSGRPMFGVGGGGGGGMDARACSDQGIAGQGDKGEELDHEPCSGEAETMKSGRSRVGCLSRTVPDRREVACTPLRCSPGTRRGRCRRSAPRARTRTGSYVGRG